MERRHFLKIAVGLAAGATAIAATANAAPLPPISAAKQVIPQAPDQGLKPAVVSQDDVEHLKPEQVRWGWHRRWRHRWHRRHWGWRRHHWHRHHWRRRWW